MCPSDTLQPILDDPQLGDALAWLHRQPLMAMVGSVALLHAGVLPQWSIREAQALALEVSDALSSTHAKTFLTYWAQHPPTQWAPMSQGMVRLCSIARILTSVRVCRPNGEVLWRFTQHPQTAPADFVPWFQVPGRRSEGTTIACGHWAALGLYRDHNIRALDTGCVWGRELTAWRVDDDTFFHEPSTQASAGDD